MNKVVYNACYGGFGLSNKAIELYAELSGFKLFPIKDGYMTFWFAEDPKGRTVDQMFRKIGLINPTSIFYEGTPKGLR